MMNIRCKKSKIHLLVLLFFAATVFIAKAGVAKTLPIISPAPLSLSPSEEKLVFVTMEKNSSEFMETIQIMNADGSNLQQIPVKSGSVDASFSWSFDSKKVAFSIVDNKAKTIRIHTVDVQSLKDQEITTHDNDGDFTAKWSSDGNKIYFVRLEGIHSRLKFDLPKGSSSPTNLWQFNIDSNQEKQVTTANNVYPLSWDWGQDGKKCFYLVTKGDLTEVWSVDIKSGKEGKVYSLNGLGNGARFISCSPKGQNILLFWQSSDFVKRDLWLLKADGSDKKKLSSEKCALMPAWITDNRILIVDEKGSMWFFDMADNQYKRVGLEVTSREPVWEAKTKKICFVKGRTIWTMDENGSNPQQIYPAISAP